MDPVSAVASVVGIIGFVGQGIRAIGELKGFCAEFSVDATQDFLHDLEVTAVVLTDARTLSEKAKSVGTALQIDYRADALNIQIDDCVRELDVWMKIAKRLKKERGGKKLNVKLQFFNSFLTAISKSSRASARDRMLEHQGNIKTTLAIFGRHVDLANTVTLRKVEETVQVISQDLSNEADQMSKRISLLSSSVSSSANSLSAQSSDMTNKLDRVTDLLQQVLSSTSSRSSNACKSESLADGVPAAMKADARTQEDDSFGAPTRQSTKSFAISDQDAEFDTLYRATNNLVKAVKELYHPLIAEYISTLHAWDTLELQLRCLDIEPTTGSWGFRNDKIDRVRSVQNMKRTAASQLLSIRKACLAESLGETLDLVAKKTGVTRDDVNQWERITADVLKDQKLELGALRFPDPNEQRRDRLTRTQEWMLGVYYASPLLLELQEAMIRRQLAERRRLNTPSDLLFDPSDEFEAQIDTSGQVFGEMVSRRTVLKYWFLDSSNFLDEDYVGSQGGTSSDSEATYRQLDTESEPFLLKGRRLFQPLIEEDKEEYEKGFITFGGSTGEPERKKSQVHSDGNLFLQADLPDLPSLRKAASVYSDAKILPHDLPPDNVNNKAREAAERALRTYSLEGAAEGKASITLRLSASRNAEINAHERKKPQVHSDGNLFLQADLPDLPSLHEAASVYSNAKTLPQDLPPDNINDKAQEATARALRTYSLEGAAEGKASITQRLRASRSADFKAHGAADMEEDYYKMPPPPKYPPPKYPPPKYPLPKYPPPKYPPPKY